MMVGELLRRIMNERNISQAKLASMMGVKNQQTIFNMLRNSRGMRIDTLVKALDALGYDVIVKDRETGEETVLKDD